jgi:DNA-binding NtrC family response regulator
VGSLPHSVLVVDDDADVRSTLAEYLAGRGFHVDEAADGLEALASVKRNRPRTVVLDLAMPRLGGVETLRYIRAFDPTIAVVIITGATDPEVHRQVQGLGRVAVVQKPFALPDLVHVLQDGHSETGPAPVVAAAAAAPGAGPRESILIVDDDDGIRAVLEELLALNGFETLAAASALDAVRVLGEHAPNVILLDIEMPGLSGLDALPAMLAMAPGAAVIMVSGHSDEELARQTLARGAFDYIVKPIDVVCLMRSIDTAIAATPGAD